ncbi:MAG: DUF4998 domain-containing protein [Niabella sp.]
MNKIFFTFIAALIVITMSQCKRTSDYYYADFLNKAENAKPGSVDSLQILPGHNRAILRFIVGPDRRVNRIKVSYNSSLSAEISTAFFDVVASDYGNYKEVQIDNLPEATLIANVLSFDNKGDSSNIATTTGLVYGNRYITSLYNRIYLRTSTVGTDKYLDFQNESRKPQDSTVFYTMLKTILTYPRIDGTTATIEFTPYSNSIPVPDIATTGTITHYSVFKPVEEAIDVFQSAPVSINF